MIGVRSSLVETQNLTVHFSSHELFKRSEGTVHAVDLVSLSIVKGETLGLVGESGCGKSTLGRALIRLIEPTAGHISFDGINLSALGRRELRRVRRRMQIVFQDPYSSLNPRMSIGTLISEPMEIHHYAKPPVIKKRVAELLRIVGLEPSCVDRYPHEFSGGQRQRIGIARALSVAPDFLVLDEPISALDVSIRAQILNLITNLKNQLSLTLLFIAHDLGVIRHISDRVAVMYLGQIVEIGMVDAIFARPAHPYTRSLLSAIPIPNPSVERMRQRIVLQGELPSPTDPPEGCRFRGRCWLYQKLGQPKRCAEQMPQTEPVGDAHHVACHFYRES